MTIPSPGDTTLTPRVAPFGRNQAKGTGEASDAAEFGHLRRGCITTRRGEHRVAEGQRILLRDHRGHIPVFVGENNGAEAFLFRPRARTALAGWRRVGHDRSYLRFLVSSGDRKPS